MPEKELRQVWDSIKKSDANDTQKEERSSQANILLESILNRKDIVLFHDEQKDGHISLEIAGHHETWSCKSKAIKRWLSSEVYRTQNKAPGSEIIKSILAVLEGKACFEGQEIKLKDRVDGITMSFGTT